MRDDRAPDGRRSHGRWRADGGRDGLRRDYRRLSLWLDTCEDDLTPRPGLPGDRDVDIAIVGAGYTGLWTAYYLATADPALRIAMVEKEIAGFGASGRNGGWCSALFAAGGQPAAMRRAMVDTVDEVGRVAAAEGIDAAYHKGGTLRLATNPAQVARIRSEVDSESDVDSRWLGAAETRARLNASGVLGAAYTPHCARVHPARLARGLARAVEARGVAVYERTPAVAVRPRTAGRPPEVVTPSGRLRAEVVVRATEAYTVDLEGQRRALVPIYSLMIATEPLPPAFWGAVGWRDRETVTDGRHLLIYAQRTADDRIAFGGRGAPYHWGSAIRPGYDRDQQVFAALAAALRGLLPGTRDAAITHRWGGPLGVPRDWHPSVGIDWGTGLGWAGGYVGDGVGTANLAGRTLADLVLGRDSERTRLPWVGHRSRGWEPEPLRWIGVNLVRRVAASADAVESRTGRPARRAALLDRVLGG